MADDTALEETRPRARLSGWDWALLLIVVALAAVPRLTRLNLAEFKLDEAKHYRMAYDLLRGSWRWTGSTASVGFPKPPLFVYALALPLAVVQDPRIVTGFLGGLASLAAGGTYALLRRRMGWKAAFGASLLFAFNPQAVLYGRKLFTADLLPPLSALFLWASLTFLDAPEERAWRSGAATALTFALLMLTTFSPAILLPVLLFTFWSRRKALRWRGWLGALAALGVPFVPYLVAVRASLVDLVTGAFSIGTNGEAAGAAPVGRWVVELLWGTSINVDGWMLAPAGLLSVLALIGGAWLLARARAREGRWAGLILIWVLLCPLVMLGLSAALPVTMHPHYLVVLYPVLFALPGAAVELADRRSWWLGTGALACLAAIAVWYAYLWNGMIVPVSAGVEGYGTPLGYWHHAASRARELRTAHQAAEVLAVVPGDEAWDEKAVVFDALLRGTPHRVVDGGTAVVFPARRTVLLIASEVEGTASRASPCTEEIADPLAASPTGGSYHYRLWDPEAEIAPRCTEALRSAEGQWASGSRLLGYQIEGLPEPGETLAVTLHWEVTGGAVEADIHWFNHLVDEDGAQPAQFDGVPWPASRWQVGDRVLWPFSLSIPSDGPPPPYGLRVGQYTYPDFERIPVVDAAGQPQSDAVDLPVPATSP